MSTSSLACRKRRRRLTRRVRGLLAAGLVLVPGLLAPGIHVARAATLCGGGGSLGAVSKVMVIWEENRPSADVLRNDNAPYIDHTLIPQCGLATAFTSRASGGHSLSNYVEELTAQRLEGLGVPGTPAGGQRNPFCSDGCVYDGDWTIGTPDALPGGSEGVSRAYFPTPGTSYTNLAHQIGSWKAYGESMPHNCDLANAGSTTANDAYVPHHIPELYFTDLNGGASFSGTSCASGSALSTRAVPLGSTTNNNGVYTSGNLNDDVVEGTLPTFSTVTPNLCDDMHSTCTYKADCGHGLTSSPTCVGDEWLKGIVPMITSGPDYQSGRLAILIVWDEGEGITSGTPGWPYTCAAFADVCVPAIVLSQHTAPGTVSDHPYDDWSIVRTVDDVLGKPELGNAGQSNSLASAFNL